MTAILETTLESGFFPAEARFFLLVDLREFFFSDLGSRGLKK